MADLSPPEDLRFINQYLQRAKELDGKEPVISYYCRYYAAQLAISKSSKNKDAQKFLMTLLDVVEEQKKKLVNQEAVTDDSVGAAYVENFALRVFQNADNEDRAGKASKKTAQTFLAASIFLEILKLFREEEDSEVAEKIKYAKYKAASIIKALREGKVPTPGPPGGDADMERRTNDDADGPGSHGGSDDIPQGFNPNAGAAGFAPHAGYPGASGFGAGGFHPNAVGGFSYGGIGGNSSGFDAPSQGPASSSSSPFSSQPAPGPTAPPRNTPASSSSSSSSSAGARGTKVSSPSSVYDSPLPADYYQTIASRSNVDHQSTEAAQKFAKYAISALQFDDVDTAIDNLQKALHTLQNAKRK